MPHSIIAEHFHIARAVQGPADLALLVEAVGDKDLSIALTLGQAEQLAALLDAHVRAQRSG